MPDEQGTTMAKCLIFLALFKILKMNSLRGGMGLFKS
jgi:hypothetical protein